MRPQCLIISISKNSTDNYEQILKYAWSKKFLDFSILTLESNANIFDAIPLVHHYNPFYKSMFKEIFNFTTQVFPQKLQNANGYPVKSFFMHHPPSMEVRKRNTGSVEITGQYLPFFKFALEAMNLKLIFTQEITEAPPGAKFWKLVEQLLDNGDINISPHLLPVTVIRNRLNIKMEYYCDEMVALVPILPAQNLIVPLEIFSYILIISIIALCIIRAIRFVHSNRRNSSSIISSGEWKIFDIVRLLIGTSVSRVPRQTSNRLIYIGVFIVFLGYASTFYSSILSIKLHHDQVPFDSFADLDRSNLPVYVNSIHFDLIFANTTDPHLKNLWQKTSKVKNSTVDCVRLLRKKRNVICIMWSRLAEYRVQRYRSADGTAVMKIAKQPLTGCDRQAILFENGSPYVEQFSRNLRKIFESGIRRHFEIIRDLRYKAMFRVKQEQEKMAESYIARFLLILLSVGYAAATAAFLVESWTNVCYRFFNEMMRNALRALFHGMINCLGRISLRYLSYSNKH